MRRDIITIGTSAGGVDALKTLAAAIPSDLPAALFVTLHLFTRNETSLPAILNRAGPLPAHYARDGEPIETGRIYVAPPDYHLVLRPEHVHLSHGPKENLQRPSINVMFRSAASAHKERVAGVVLTGMLDDGAAGLWEIQQKGGMAIVQDPDEAAYRSMPESAIQGLGTVDHIVSVKEMGALFGRVSSQAEGERRTPMEELSQPSELSSQSCPVCGGVMRRATLGQMYEYRCHVGHRLGVRTMITEKTNSQERALAAALAETEELIFLLQETKGKVDPETARYVEDDITLRQEQVNVLRKLLDAR